MHIVNRVRLADPTFQRDAAIKQSQSQTLRKPNYEVFVLDVAVLLSPTTFLSGIPSAMFVLGAYMYRTAPAISLQTSVIFLRVDRRPPGIRNASSGNASRNGAAPSVWSVDHLAEYRILGYQPMPVHCRRLHKAANLRPPLVSLAHLSNVQTVYVLWDIRLPDYKHTSVERHLPVSCEILPTCTSTGPKRIHIVDSQIPTANTRRWKRSSFVQCVHLNRTTTTTTVTGSLTVTISLTRPPTLIRISVIDAINSVIY